MINLVPLKKEGEVAHPDAYGIGFGNGYKFTDEQYLRQLRGYAKWAGVENTKNTICERPHLLDLLEEEKYDPSKEINNDIE